jgi:hypothetical protein
VFLRSWKRGIWLRSGAVEAAWKRRQAPRAVPGGLAPTANRMELPTSPCGTALRGRGDAAQDRGLELRRR